MPKLLCLLVLASACASGQRIEGMVADSVTGNGIPGMKVEIVPVNGTAAAPRMVDLVERTALYSATTDAQGRFRIDDVQDGFYFARYRAPGYQDASLAPTRDSAPPARFQVRAASGTAMKLEGRMFHFAWMSGRLV